MFHLEALEENVLFCFVFLFFSFLKPSVFLSLWPLPLSSKCITLPYASSDTSLPSSCPFYEDSCDYGRCTWDRHLDNSRYSSHFKIRNRTCTFPLAIEGNVPRFLGQGYGHIWGPLFSPPQRVWIVRREKWFCRGLLSLLLLSRWMLALVQGSDICVSPRASTLPPHPWPSLLFDEEDSCMERKNNAVSRKKTNHLDNAILFSRKSIRRLIFLWKWIHHLLVIYAETTLCMIPHVLCWLGWHIWVMLEFIKILSTW